MKSSFPGNALLCPEPKLCWNVSGKGSPLKFGEFHFSPDMPGEHAHWWLHDSQELLSRFHGHRSAGPDKEW